MTSGRALLVPIVPQGSVGKFCDFLLGYLLPPGVDLQMVPPGGMLRRLVIHGERRVGLRSLGNPRTCSRSELAEFVGGIRAVADVPDAASGQGIVVVERGQLRDAVSLRTVPNLAEVAAAAAVRAHTYASGPQESVDAPVDVDSVVATMRLRRVQVVGLALRRLR